MTSRVFTMSRCLPRICSWQIYSKNSCFRVLNVQCCHHQRMNTEQTFTTSSSSSVSELQSRQRILTAKISYDDSRTRSSNDSSLSSNTNNDMPNTTEDTIVAIVTPAGGQHGAVDIVRVSGPSALHIAKTFFVPASRRKKSISTWQPVSHKVEYGTFLDASGALVDEVLLVPMLAPRSYTREDVIEFQCHGGGICSRRVLQLCLEAGARLAKPGEFTLRAFLNGRLDLSQAENVAQLVSAKTVSAADSALAGLQGGLSSLVQSLRKECIEMLAEIDARLDFEDELPDLDTSLLMQRIENMEKNVKEALKTEKRGKLLQAGIQVAIIGRPNVGKSSLLNAWSQTERAIVTDVAGTTRDVVEAGIVVAGYPLRLLDTAGIRETGDVVESIGVERSIIAARGADVIIMVVDAQAGWTDDDTQIFEKVFKHEVKSASASSILVINKIDQAPTTSLQQSQFAEYFDKVVLTSAKQRVGFDHLETAFVDLLGSGEISNGGQAWAVNQRQAEQLLRTSKALERLQVSIKEDLPLDFWTIDLKEAAIALGEISGDEVSEEVLSQIFSKFCIGK